MSLFPDLPRPRWPKLSETLPAATTTMRCQRCGKECDLARWREHDDQDRPTGTVILICDDCEKIIEPHPRLYDRLDFHEPHPGSMPTCEGCRHRQGLRCGHPLTFDNGGPGLPLYFDAPTVGFIDGTTKGGKRLGQRFTHYHSPVRCDCRELLLIEGDGA